MVAEVTISFKSLLRLTTESRKKEKKKKKKVRNDATKEKKEKDIKQTVFQQTEQDVRVQGAFVGFVHDNDRVAVNIRFPESLAEQDTVSHVLDLGGRRGAILEANGIAHLLPEGAAHLLRNSLGNGHGGDTTGLGASNHSVLAVAVLAQVLGELGGLAGAGFSHDHHNLVFPDDSHQLGAIGKDGQVLPLLPDGFRAGKGAHRIAIE